MQTVELINMLRILAAELSEPDIAIDDKYEIAVSLKNAADALEKLLKIKCIAENRE